MSPLDPAARQSPGPAPNLDRQEQLAGVIGYARRHTSNNKDPTMDMPTPTAEHEKLLRLVGTWTGKETMHPSPWMPDGCIADGTTTSRAALSGFGVVTDYAQSMGGQVTFQGHGVYTVDAQTSDVVLFWFDSMGGQCEQFRGGWHGDQLILQSKSPMMGHMRMTYDFQADGSMLSRMENSQDGESWTSMFDGVYSKAD